MGTTGPNEINPKTNKIYGIEFPTITIQDMVRVQKILVDELKIDKLLSVVGGSMGSMQVLQWAATYPESLRSIISIAGALKSFCTKYSF